MSLSLFNFLLYLSNLSTALEEKRSTTWKSERRSYSVRRFDFNGKPLLLKVFECQLHGVPVNLIYQVTRNSKA